MELPGKLEFYRGVLENLQGDVVVLDTEGRYVYLNQYAIKDNSIRDWMIGRTVFDYCELKGRPPQVAQTRNAYLRKAISEKRMLEWEECLENDSGEIRHYSRRLFPVLSQAGEIDYLIGHGIDITALRIKEQELTESERRLNEAQLLSRTGSYQLSFNTGQIEWSVGMYAIFGVDLNRKPDLELFYTLLHPEDRPAVEEAVALMKPDDPPWAIRYRIILPTDEVRHIEAHSKIVLDPESNTPVLVGSCQDVTEREILLSSLRQKETELQESVKTKETFLANISHELRTPLNGVLGIIRLLRKTQLNGIQREYIEVMNETAGNLLVIINDLLDFARWQSGEYSFEESVFDPFKVADSSLQLQVFRAQEKGLSIKHLWEGDVPVPLVLGDPHRLSQVLLNLLSNAVKFTDQGGVVLKQSVLSDDSDSVLMQFSVSDTGIGIPAHMHNRIFESFTQVNTSEFGAGGLGLGLAISKSLVEKQGGHIRVESTPDKGSTFIFELRYPKAGMRSDRTAQSYTSTTDPSTIRVLVVDDNKVNLFVTEAMLKGWHMQVKLAMSGQEAIDQLHLSDFDIILMDIQMPGMDGIETTRLIRSFADLKKSQVPILAVTANTSRTTRRKCIAGGMNDCLVKPFKEDALFRKMMACVSPAMKVGGLSRPARRLPRESKEGSISNTLYELSGLTYATDSNREFLIRMLSIFNETVPSTVEAMLGYYTSGDIKSVSELAHKIRPTLDGSGIVSLKETIRNIEHFKERKRTNEELCADLEQLSAVIRQVSSQFSQEMDRLLRQKIS